MSKKKIGVILMVGGVLLNIADAYTANGSATGGYFYGTNGVLKTINDALPVSFGVAAAGVGAALYFLG